MRPGILQTAAAIVMAVVTAVVVRVTATESVLFVTQLLGVMLLIFVGSLLAGFSKAMASATAPMLAAVMIQANFADDPSWIRSMVLGCLWFTTVELGWEALDRRDGSVRTRRATARRIQEVVTVVGCSLAVGLIAVLGTEFAPVRTVLLQAVVLGLVLASFVILIRRVAVTSPNSTSPNP